MEIKDELAADEAKRKLNVGAEDLTKKSKSRFLRFSLASFLGFICLAGMALGIYGSLVQPMKKQWEDVNWLRSQTRFGTYKVIASNDGFPAFLKFFMPEDEIGFVTDLSYKGLLGIADDEVAVIAGLPKLERLVINAGLKNEQCDLLSTSKSLVKLSLRRRGPVTMAGIETLSKCKSLKTIDVTGIEFFTWRDRLAVQDRGGPDLKNDSPLELSDVRIEDLRELARLKNNQLRDLSISNRYLVHNDYIREALMLFPDLETLRIGKGPLMDFETVGSILGHRRLKDFEINAVSPSAPSVHEAFELAWESLVHGSLSVSIHSIGNDRRLELSGPLDTVTKKPLWTKRINYGVARQTENMTTPIFENAEIDVLKLLRENHEIGSVEEVRARGGEFGLKQLRRMTNLNRVFFELNEMPDSFNDYLKELENLDTFSMRLPKRKATDSRNAIPLNMFEDWKSQNSLYDIYLTECHFDPKDFVRLANFPNLFRVILREEDGRNCFPEIKRLSEKTDQAMNK